MVRGAKWFQRPTGFMVVIQKLVIICSVSWSFVERGESNAYFLHSICRIIIVCIGTFPVKPYVFNQPCLIAGGHVLSWSSVDQANTPKDESHRRLQTSLISYNSTVNCCEKAQRWKLGVRCNGTVIPDEWLVNIWVKMVLSSVISS